MLTVLTYQGNTKKTIVNLSEVKTIYEVYNKEEGCFTTKIVFNTSTPRMEDFINVTETIEDIANIVNEVRTNGTQTVDFTRTVKTVIKDGYDRFKTRHDQNFNRQEEDYKLGWNS